MLCKVQYSTKSPHLQGLICTSVHPFSRLYESAGDLGIFWDADEYGYQPFASLRQHSSFFIYLGVTQLRCSASQSHTFCSRQQWDVPIGKYRSAEGLARQLRTS